MTKSNWWMYHGGPEHDGLVTGSHIDRSNAATLRLLHDIDIPGPVLSVPAIVDGFVYVGLANSLEAPAAHGGVFLKIDIETGKTVHRFDWTIDPADGDSHGFMGMGCTPDGTDMTSAMARSLHAGGVNCCFADGSVHFVKNTVSQLTWVQLLSRSDGQVTGTDY